VSTPGARRRTSLAARLMTAQVLVIAVGSLTLAVAAGLVAPGLFRRHLARSGVDSASLRHHAEQAFASSFALSLTVAAGAALLTAGLASWILVRRVAQPVEQLALAADAVAAGRYDVTVPDAPFSSELQRLSDAFAHMANRLADTDAARSRLLSDLAHELRTPLATLSAYIDGLEDGVVPPNAPSWQTMRAQVTRLSRLSTDVREAATAQENALGLRPVLTNPIELARAAIAAATLRYASNDVALDLHGVTEAPDIRADPDRLSQVLSNLLDNALRHTPAGGTVTVTVDTRPKQVLLQVADDGSGIPEDQLEAIFERFHRADTARLDTAGAGSGLGLTIARAIVHAHGGTLTATSTGRGATFTIALPRPAGEKAS
jgi:two-component system sensor histidine kinase BaeS